jgi:hypothetical protein
MEEARRRQWSSNPPTRITSRQLVLRTRESQQPGALGIIPYLRFSRSNDLLNNLSRCRSSNRRPPLATVHCSAVTRNVGAMPLQRCQERDGEAPPAATPTRTSGIARLQWVGRRDDVRHALVGSRYSASARGARCDCHGSDSYCQGRSIPSVDSRRVAILCYVNETALMRNGRVSQNQRPGGYKKELPSCAPVSVPLLNTSCR